jgi:hypothetical protein
MDELFDDSTLDGLGDAIAAAALTAPVPSASSGPAATVETAHSAAAAPISGVLRVPVLNVPAGCIAGAGAGAVPATSSVPSGRSAVVHFINYPRAVFLNISVSSDGVGAPAAAASPPQSLNLVTATPSMLASQTEPATSCLLVEGGADSELLEGLARKFCMRLKKMVLLSCDVGVKAGGAGFAGDEAAAALAASRVHHAALQAMAAMLQ